LSRSTSNSLPRSMASRARRGRGAKSHWQDLALNQQPMRARRASIVRRLGSFETMVSLGSSIGRGGSFFSVRPSFPLGPRSPRLGDARRAGRKPRKFTRRCARTIRVGVPEGDRLRRRGRARRRVAAQLNRSPPGGRHPLGGRNPANRLDAPPRKLHSHLWTRRTAVPKMSWREGTRGC
jgi:hypothetical protein